ncbi:MAG: HEAT repeat domain-containing protein [Nitrospirales bacterium]|nr:HEAT repeat domain-containing protein [Nitrospirales bacterium]
MIRNYFAKPVFAFSLSLIVLIFSSSVSFAVSDSFVAEFQRNDWESRLMNAQGISRFSDEALFHELLDMVGNPGIDWGIRIRGIKLMGALGTDRAATNLVNMMNDPFFNHECPSIKSYVAAALGKYRGDSSVVTALIKGTTDGELLVREASIGSLATIGDTRAVPSIIEALKDRSDAVKIRAISALATLGDPRAIVPLKALAEGAGDQVIKDQASLALRGLTAKSR